MTPCIIFDLDGTLADVRHRLHFLSGTPKNWLGFFKAAAKDKPIAFAVALCNALAARYPIIICSGRPVTYVDLTREWLARYDVTYNGLYMRSEAHNKHHTPDVKVKLEMLSAIRGDGLEPMCAVDDRPDVINMWRANGVPCLAMEPTNWERFHLSSGGPPVASAVETAASPAQALEPAP